jgi:hypothetical protein
MLNTEVHEVMDWLWEKVRFENLERQCTPFPNYGRTTRWGRLLALRQLHFKLDLQSMLDVQWS